MPTKNTTIIVRATPDTKDQLTALVADSVCTTISEYMRHLIHREFSAMVLRDQEQPRPMKNLKPIE